MDHIFLTIQSPLGPDICMSLNIFADSRELT